MGELSRGTVGSPYDPLLLKLLLVSLPLKLLLVWDHKGTTSSLNLFLFARPNDPTRNFGFFISGRT